jgi:hypothetical protein
MEPVERISVSPWQWRQALLDRHAPSEPAARVVALVVEAHMSRNEAVAWPSQQEIAARARLSERTVRRAIDALDKCGWIKRRLEKRPGRQWKLTIYEPAVPATLAHTIKSHAGGVPVKLTGRQSGQALPVNLTGRQPKPSVPTRGPTIGGTAVGLGASSSGVSLGIQTGSSSARRVGDEKSATTGQPVRHDRTSGTDDRTSGTDDRPNGVDDRTQLCPTKSSSEAPIQSLQSKHSSEGGAAPMCGPTETFERKTRIKPERGNGTLNETDPEVQRRRAASAALAARGAG